MPYKDKEKQKEATRERVRRYRERHNVTPKDVTPEPNTVCCLPEWPGRGPYRRTDDPPDGVAPKVQHFNPMMVGYEPVPR
jgi:hypothetical protein